MAINEKKGFLLEELLRAYFLRAGMYVMRGIQLRIDGDDLTDIDIWLYERPTGSSRRRQIVDVKSKAKPKAIERLLWTKGLCELLEVDGAYIATTDNRSMLKKISSQLKVSILDGVDIKRISESNKVLYTDRLSEEDFEKKLKSIDRSRRNKNLQITYQDLKSVVINNFGANTVNLALEYFANLAHSLTLCHPNSKSAEATLRLVYFAASISAVALDFSLAQVSFKSTEERRKLLLNTIRFGADNEETGMEKVRIATALVARYAPNGKALSQTILNSIQSDLQNIPADIIVDYVLHHLKGDALFQSARSLEHNSFSNELRGFDQLTHHEKSLLGTLLDFSEVDRSIFANRWKNNNIPNPTKDPFLSLTPDNSNSLGPLFDN